MNNISNDILEENKNIIFSTTDLTLNNVLSEEEFVKYIIPIVENILKKRFPDNIQKQKIKIYKDRLAFAAPCCGDSVKDLSKKRGNIILSGKYKNSYKCHNCGKFMPLNHFFKEYTKDIDLNIVNYIYENKDTSSFKTIDTPVNILFNNDEINKYAIDKEVLMKKCNMITPNVGEAFKYLKNRNQYDLNKFLYNEKYKLLFILNLTQDNKIIGLQIRSLDKYYRGPKYKTYTLSKIYEILLKDKETIIPDNINNISAIFNLLIVDINKPILVTEGPLDSFLIKNSIALSGASNHLKIDLDYKFIFDDDITGKKHAIEKLNEGYYVFLWSKIKKDYNLPNRNKWDINDFIDYCKNNKESLPNFNNYFSNDSLDVLDI